VLADMNDDRVSVLVNDGGARFAARRDYRTGFMPRAVAISDLTGDGRPDLATANSGYLSTRYPVWYGVSVLVSSGGGRFRQKLDYETRGNAFPFAVALADLDGDRRLDLAAGSAADGGPPVGTLSVLLNRRGLCDVQNLVWMKLSVARRFLPRANCRFGAIRRAHSPFPSGRVYSQHPAPGRVLAPGARVNAVVSLGPRG
jgi:VCBS repeat protein